MRQLTADETTILRAAARLIHEHELVRRDAREEDRNHPTARHNAAATELLAEMTRLGCGYVKANVAGPWDPPEADITADGEWLDNAYRFAAGIGAFTFPLTGATVTPEQTITRSAPWGNEWTGRFDARKGDNPDEHHTDGPVVGTFNTAHEALRAADKAAVEDGWTLIG